MQVPFCLSSSIGRPHHPFYLIEALSKSLSTRPTRLRYAKSIKSAKHNLLKSDAKRDPLGKRRPQAYTFLNSRHHTTGRSPDFLRGAGHLQWEFSNASKKSQIQA
jgi:hypothetical protein